MMGSSMKQFENMGWIRQGFLGLIVCAVMSPSHAMSVRERYLLQHPQAAAPQAAAPQEAVKSAQSTKVVKHGRKHHAVEKLTPVRHQTAHHHRAKVEQPVEKNSSVHPAKSHHQRVTVPKLAKPKFNHQQARDAEAALKHGKVKHETLVSHHKHQVASTKKATHTTHHAVKYSTEHRVLHHKRYHAK
ncbi:MAG: hypothetical protein NVS3B3_14600 [Aquirhabdus sp.]